MWRIGVDLGGSKTEAALLDASGQIALRKRVATPGSDYAATLRTVATLVMELEAHCGSVCSVGVGTPGARSPKTGLLRNANSVCLNGRALDSDLSELLGREVRISNDANCFALSEAIDGAAADAHSVFGVILGTGTGGGIVIGGRLLEGPNAIAGEWGHNPLPWPRDDERPGRACYCGKHGCIETFLCGPALAQDFAPDARLSAQQIAQRAAQGDIEAETCLKRYENRLARALAHVVNIIDPDVIVLGGGLSNLERLYSNLPVQLASYVFSDTLLTRIVPPKHGDSSGVRGAAWLWPG